MKSVRRAILVSGTEKKACWKWNPYDDRFLVLSGLATRLRQQSPLGRQGSGVLAPGSIPTRLRMVSGRNR